MASVIRRALNDFPQTNTIIKTTKVQLSGGRKILTEITPVSIDCLILKRKRNLKQDKEGIVNEFSTYVIAETSVSPTIITDDILITQDGKKFIVRAVSIKNEKTGIQTRGMDAAYLYGDLELYTD